MFFQPNKQLQLLLSKKIVKKIGIGGFVFSWIYVVNRSVVPVVGSDDGKSNCAKRGKRTWIPPMEFNVEWTEWVTTALTSCWKNLKNMKERYIKISMTTLLEHSGVQPTDQMNVNILITSNFETIYSSLFFGSMSMNQDKPKKKI